MPMIHAGPHVGVHVNGILQVSWTHSAQLLLAVQHASKERASRAMAAMMANQTVPAMLVATTPVTAQAEAGTEPFRLEATAATAPAAAVGLALRAAGGISAAGKYFGGDTSCSAGLACIQQNPYYSQVSSTLLQLLQLSQLSWLPRMSWQVGIAWVFAMAAGRCQLCTRQVNTDYGAVPARP